MKNKKIVIQQFIRKDLFLLVGTDATRLFEYFGVENLHGLTLQSCKERIKEGETYIDGFCNVIPLRSWGEDKVIFFNQTAFTDDKVKNYGLIFHECMHYQFSKFFYDYDKFKCFNSQEELTDAEENLVTETEILAIDIYKTIFKEKKKSKKMKNEISLPLNIMLNEDGTIRIRPEWLRNYQNEKLYELFTSVDSNTGKITFQYKSQDGNLLFLDQIVKAIRKENKI